MRVKLIAKGSGSTIVLILALVIVMAFVTFAAGAAPDFGTGGDTIDGTTFQPPDAALDTSFIVLMDLAPAVRYKGEIIGINATAPPSGGKYDAAAAAAYAAYSIERQDAVLNGAGLSQTAVTNRYTTALNGFSAVMTTQQVEKIARQPGVAAVLKDTWRQPLTDNTPSFLGLDGVGDAWATGYDGEGVIVGVIDSGIWPEHPSFVDDGTYANPRVNLENTNENRACNFGNTDHNHNDARFRCNRKLVAARQMLNTYRFFLGAESYEFDSARDENGHGTHTASTAAGNRNVPASLYGQDLGLVSGVAPRAYVMAYKGLGAQGGFASDLAAAIDQAVADGVDVINYSVGGPSGPPSADDIAFLNAAAAGVHVATSAGNSGPDPASLGNPAVFPWLTTVGANTQNRFFKGDILLNDGRSYYGASITTGLPATTLIDAAVAGDEYCHPGELEPDLVAGKVVLCRRGDNARATKSQAVNIAGGAGMILYNNSDDDNLMTDSHWVPSVHVDQTPGLQLKAAAANQPYWANAYIPLVSGGAATDTTVTPPKPATTVAIDSVDNMMDWIYAPSMAIFSSRGPNPIAPDIIKPDTTAPGVQILAGNSPSFDGSTLYKKTGDLFQAIQGTSMSSPQVAGVFALLDQAHPDWSPAAVKSAIMTTANTAVVDNDRHSPATPFSMGAGHVNPGHAANEGSPFQPGLVYHAGLFDYLGFLCEVAPELIYVDPVSACAILEQSGYPTDAHNLNVPSIGIADLPGMRTVKRTVTSVAEVPDAHTYTVSVAAPPGFEVDITPGAFDITRGAEITYELTATNIDAPIGEWRFGSLTWTGSDGTDSIYAVTSPIALQAGWIETPSNLIETGADSAASFDIHFGYTGDYAIEPHGLEPAALNNDTVPQDPDQLFNPYDGYSNLYQAEMSGDAYFRVILPPGAVADPKIDLDLYLFDPTGQFYDLSANPGSLEEIEVTFPEDGTWTLFVHGYDTLGPSAKYTMYDWLISNEPGGSLQIDASPDAVLATKGAVEYSWTDAANSWYMGAFSHRGGLPGEDPMFFGLTILDVDNRN